jgi:hypothetical protein
VSYETRVTTDTEVSKMFFFPTRIVVHPEEVRERIQVEHRLRQDQRRAADVVDEASQDSFPASDPPPWTLGWIKSSLPPVDVGTREAEAITD